MSGGIEEIAGTSFDLFGTLVEVVDPPDPVASIGSALERRGIDVPVDWKQAYTEPPADGARTQEIPLPEHVVAVLESRGIAIDGPDMSQRIEAAVLDAFGADVRRRPGSLEVIEAATVLGPVGILSNCSVPGLARRSLQRAGIDVASIDAVVTSVQLGWRKPDRRSFLGISRALGVEIDRLLHVGDDHRTDRAAGEFGAQVFLIDQRSLPEIAAVLRDRC